VADELVGVRIEGLAELRRAFREAGNGSQKAIARRLKEAATLVASEAAGRVPVWPGPARRGQPRPGSAAASVRPYGTQSGAGIRGGGASAPHYPWLDFGGTTGRGHRPGVAGSGSVVRPWMGKPAGEGRYIYPAVRDLSDILAESVGEAVHEALRDAGFTEG
jgi:hypothetical protein